MVRKCITMLSALPVPLNCCLLILGHANAILQTVSEIVLSSRMALQRGTLVPTRAFSLVLADTNAILVTKSQIALRPWVSLVG